MTPTPAIHVHRSNRTEKLADLLADLLRVPSGGPFDPETIVVQGRGMAVWLSQRLALSHRVVANTEFTYPRQLVLRAFHAVLGEGAVNESAVSEEGLFWKVLSTLPQLLSRPEFARVAEYLKNDEKGLRRFQLAERIATRFDQYLTYRPEMVRVWERGEDGEVPAEQAWQPLLFRALGDAISTGHVAALEAAYRDALRRGKKPNSSPKEGLPARLALFGISSLPPLFLRVIAGLAPHVELHLFAFSPSPKDFWNQTRAEDLVQALKNGVDPGDQHLDAGSPLLASMGALGVEFEKVLEEGLGAVGAQRIDEDHFSAPDAPGMLGTMQTAVYDLLKDPDSDAKRVLLPDDDRSIVVHSCHGPMREVEVLHDQLLDLLTREGSTLEPRDVVVMTPDVDAYAPFIEAVFDRAKNEQYVPYRISDRSVRTDSPVIDAFQRVLGLVGGRAEASTVLDLLNLTSVQQHFGIDANELEQITEWVVASGIRWGIDEGHRAAHGQPAERQNTWRFGMNRLLVGYAMPTDGRGTFEGVVPFEEIEGKSAELLGSLAEFTERLFATLQTLEGKRTLTAWRTDLARALASLVARDSRSDWQHRVILDALDELVEGATAAGFTEDVELAAVARLLERRIDTSYPERGFLSSGVTFCAMLPMRSIPFRVVCLLGMNDGAYPRSARPVDFDLIRKGPSRPGDRDRRKDDRYLFLEALMAAREALVITYTGQSIRDNATRPSSVVVNELLDRVERWYRPQAPYDEELERLALLRERLVVRHPLQAFSHRYFDGNHPRLFSFVEAYRDGAVHAAGKREKAPPFFVESLPAPAERAPHGEGDRTIQLSELVRFYEDPVGCLLTRRLGVYLRDTGVDVPDREPVEVTGLERWKVGEALLRGSLDGLGAAATRALSRGRGELPLGRYGELVHAEIGALAAGIADRARAVRDGVRHEPVTVNRTLPDGTRIVGEIGDLWGEGFFRHQFSRVRAKYQISVWVRHAVLCWAARPDARSVLVGQAEKGDDVATVTFEPLGDPEAYLITLARYYRAGMSGPLRFTPGSALSYADAILKGKGEEAALAAARRAYGDADSGERVFGPHLARVFGDEEPGFDGVVAAPFAFDELARAVALPLVEKRSVS